VSNSFHDRLHFEQKSRVSKFYCDLKIKGQEGEDEQKEACQSTRPKEERDRQKSGEKRADWQKREPVKPNLLR